MRARTAGPGTIVLIAMCIVGFANALAAAPLAMRGDPDPSKMCTNAAILAAHKYGIPPSVMLAITLTETGHLRHGELVPWPWAVNIGGKGYWFESRPEAERFVKAAFAKGRRNYDAGCFQINRRWHPEAYPEPTTTFDANSSADYAARFLVSLFETSGDWSRAAGAYHSLTPKFAARYRARFDRIRVSQMDADNKGQDTLRQVALNLGPRLPGSLFLAPAQPTGQLINLGAQGASLWND